MAEEVKSTYTSNYREKLNNFLGYVKEEITGNTKNCVEVLQSQVEEAINQLPDDQGEVFMRTISKDLSRYHDSFAKYLKALDDLSKTNNLILLRHKIVRGDKDFFKDVWKENSDNFFRTRKYLNTNLRDISLESKINSSLDCIVTSLYRYVYKKYGGK